MDQSNLASKAERGVFLGYYPKNSCYLVGVWRPDGRTTGGLKFTVTENASVKFDESILVSNVDDIKPNTRGVFVTFPRISELGDFDSYSSDVVGPVVSPGLLPDATRGSRALAAEKGLNSKAAEFDSGET